MPAAADSPYFELASGVPHRVLGVQVVEEGGGARVQNLVMGS